MDSDIVQSANNCSTELENRVNEFIRGREYYDELVFSSERVFKSAKLPFLYSATLFAINSLMNEGNNRICVIMPDDNASVMPLVLMDVVYKDMQKQFDPYENLKDIQPGQKMRIGKAIIEVIEITKDAFVFRDAEITKDSEPWMKTWYQYLEPVDSSRKLSSHKLLHDEIDKKEKLASVNNTIQRLVSDRGATSSTSVVLSTKSSIMKFTDELIISGRGFKEVFTIGEFDIDNGWYVISSKNHNIPQITIATEVSQIIQCMNDRVVPTIDKFIVTQDKVRELLTNIRSFEKMLKTNKPIIVFLSENDYERFVLLDKYKFSLFHWKPSTLKDNSFKSDSSKYKGTLFESIAEKTNNAAYAKFDVQLCRDDALSAYYKTLKDITSGSKDFSSSYKEIIHRFWNFFRDLCSNCSFSGISCLESLSEIELRWNQIKDNYHSDIQNKIAFLFDCGSKVGCKESSAKNDLICDLISKYTDSGSIAVLVPDRCPYIDDLRAGLRERYSWKRILVYSYSNYLSLQKDKVDTYSKLIVTWFDKHDYLQIKNSYSYRELVFILYDFEEKWRRVYRNEVNNYLDHDKVISSMRMMGLNKSVVREVPFDYKEESIDTSTIQPDNEYDYAKALRELYSGEGSAKVPSGMDYVQACTIIAGSYKINYLVTHKLIEVKNLILESGEARSKKANELVHGDCILVRSSDKDIIAGVADKMIGSNAFELRETSQLWVKCLQLIIEKLGYDSCCELMCKDGLCSKQQIRYWSVGEVICPDNPEVLRRIADILKSDDSETAKLYCSDVSRVYSAGRTIQKYHVKAGNSISKSLRNRVNEIKQFYLNGSEGQIQGIGKVMILEIDDVFTNQYVNRNTLNKLEVL